MKIAILGAGAFGSALGEILSDNGHQISYYDPLILSNTLKEVLDAAQYIVLAIPSRAIVDVLPSLPTDVPIVVATKGLLGNEIFKRFHDVMVISGPGFASDIKNHQTTYFTITDQRLAELFGANYIHFDYTTDMKGVLMCGALKNVYAMAAGWRGIVIDSIIGAQFAKEALSEMADILRINQANPDTVKLHCGLDDLKATCKLPSRNFEFGTIIRDNPSYTNSKTVEGIEVIKRIRANEIKLPEKIPILSELLARSREWV